MQHRSEKLSALIRNECAAFLKTRADVPSGVLCTVMHVVLSPDNRYADVYISIFPTSRIGIFLNKFKTWQHEFNVYAKETLRLRNIPVIRFKLDDTMVKQERIEKLLGEEQK